ncbi:phage tail protein, partial [Ralstonia nicotianae]
MTDTVYHYDPTTGEYAGSSPADHSPLEPGVVLIPAHATDQAPP